MTGERKRQPRSKHVLRACHASRQVGRSRERRERCTLERAVRRERLRLERGKNCNACISSPLFLLNLNGFILGREALIRLVRIKARFMRQCEQRFARYHKTHHFMKQSGLCLRLT